jgi:N-acetylmuramoyl-L-alanine amidase
VTVALVETPSGNHDDRPHGTVVDILLLHYTGMKSAGDALQRLCDPAVHVSCHYLVDEDGTIYRLVQESRRAWHAGVSFWNGERDINARSIGIEIVNPGHEFGYRPFPPVQMKAVTTLARDIVGRHAIPAERVLGHSDVAPTRKQDPGELFDWQALARDGVGLWPDGIDETDTPAAELLKRYGYETGTDEVTAASLLAFQRHFRPARLDGVGDDETRGLLASLCRQAGV